MNGLRHLQAGFLDAIMAADGDGLKAGMRVYHHAYRSRLIEALRDRFERVWTWLGDARFDGLAAQYIAANPSVTWTLDAYGGAFADFLAAACPDDPEVAELAWLDGALRQVFAGPDADGMDPVRLAGVDWDKARLVVAPTLVWRKVATNGASLWRALSREEAPPVQEMLPESMGLIVWRKGLEPRFRTVETEELRALQALRAGARFAEVCAGLEGADATAKAGAWLGGWIRDEVVVDVEDRIA